MMINAQPRRDTTSHQDHVLLRALSSITPEQTAVIAQAVHTASADTWTTEALDDYDGYRSILVDARRSNEQSASYFVSGTAQRLDLFKACDDQLIPIGCFNNVAELSAKLVSLLAEP